MKTIKLSKLAQAKIDEFNEKLDEHNAARERVLARITELTDALDGAKTELTEAMDATIAKQTDANERKEAEARAKVSELETQLEAAKERRTRVSQTRSFDTIGEAVSALKVVKSELSNDYNVKADKALQAIEDAKDAYLNAIQAYGQLQKDAREAFLEAGRATSMKALEDVGYLYFRPVAWNYFAHDYSDGNRYTVRDLDMNKALRCEYVNPRKPRKEGE